ncbi:hypothetical protein HYC85_000768 [Camellia sinensis]|uniref:Secreted protein n=1 Tax=Camellia sinensis TaxID=4442 RepID=A0A7J7I3Q8_CAMSI|nr:hypothetical protein HYC85_000768 [Camellia sinensis]
MWSLGTVIRRTYLLELLTVRLVVKLAHWVPIARLRLSTKLPAYVNHTATNCHPDGQIILVVELIYGQMLVAVVKYSVRQDHIVQRENLANPVVLPDLRLVDPNSIRHYCRKGSISEKRKFLAEVRVIARHIV